MGNSNFLLFFMAGILITTAWGTSVLLGNLEEDWQGPQPDIEIQTAYQGENGLEMTMANNGEPANFSQFKIQYRINDQVYTHSELQEQRPDQAVNNTCFDGRINWKTGVTYNCQTGIQFPEAQQRITLIVNYADGEMKWRHVCQPSTSTAVGC